MDGEKADNWVAAAVDHLNKLGISGEVVQKTIELVSCTGSDWAMFSAFGCSP